MQCGCPCRYGEWHQLSHTSNYIQQCFENNQFKESNKFTCSFYDDCDGIIYRELKSLAYDPCQNNKCQNDGKCQKNLYTYICNCPEGFDGTYCQNNKGDGKI